jgi:general secretion pathway protein H
MPVSAARRTAGFTLLEMMVVMVLIGIIFSFATLSMRGDDVAVLMKQEAQRMETLVNLASDEAVIRGEELAVRFRDDGYEFLLLGDAGWQTAQDGLLKDYSMPADIELRLDVSGDLPVFSGKEKDEEESSPQVFILSSGEITPFSVVFQSGLSKHEYLLDTSILGTVTVTSEERY